MFETNVVYLGNNMANKKKDKKLPLESAQVVRHMATNLGKLMGTLAVVYQKEDVLKWFKDRGVDMEDFLLLDEQLNKVAETFYFDEKH